MFLFWFNSYFLFKLINMYFLYVCQAISLLKEGNEVRAIRCTGANRVSSRSHAILIVVLRQIFEEHECNSFEGGSRQSRLLFVDLAGSERAKHTKVIKVQILFF